MNNKEGAKAYLQDAEIIVEEARASFGKRHYHRVVRQ
jgi:hypothetical protein